VIAAGPLRGLTSQERVFPRGTTFWTESSPAIISRKVLPMAKSKRARAEKPWSTMDLFDLRRAIEQAETIELTASVLGRRVNGLDCNTDCRSEDH
jgi:hypothetical protein